MQTISISEIQRNLHKLDGFDIVQVVDKKRNQIKGYFLDSSYQQLIEKLVGKKQKKNQDLLNIIGIVNSEETVTKESLREERLAQYE
jgi:predicted CopG family antitoxin